VQFETDYHNAHIQQPQPQAKPWGPWATVGLGAVIFFVYSMAQGIVLFAVALFSILSLPDLAEMDIQQITDNIMTNGLALSLSIIIAAPVGILLIIVFAKMRKGISLGEYLGFRALRAGTLFVLMVIPVVLVIIAELIGIFVVKSSDPGFMVEAYQNSVWPPLFWIATVIVAPAFEETLFRGFAFAGLRQSRIGPTGAVGLTAAIWALLHIQYDWFGMTTILVIGIVLGIARIKTGSLWAPMTIHAVWNLLQMIAIVLYLNGIIK
jgi:membrane protease YdiL (CAAX protease family)